jgi:hypothetical protein
MASQLVLGYESDTSEYVEIDNECSTTVVVQLALLSPTLIASPLARAPSNSDSAVIVMRSHCSSAQHVARFMSLAATAQGCVSITLSSSEWALKQC